VWAARISAVKEQPRLSDGVLCLAPLGPAAVAAVDMAATGLLLGYVALRRIVPVVLAPETWIAGRADSRLDPLHCARWLSARSAGLGAE
jgi:hypothetical protein